MITTVKTSVTVLRQHISRMARAKTTRPRSPRLAGAHPPTTQYGGQISLLYIVLCLSCCFLPSVSADPIPTLTAYGEEHFVDGCHQDSCKIDEYCLDHGSGISVCYPCTQICPGYPPEENEDSVAQAVAPGPTPSFECLEKCPRYIKQFEEPDDPTQGDVDYAQDSSSASGEGFLGKTLLGDIALVAAVVVLAVIVCYLLWERCTSNKATNDSTGEHAQGGKEEKKVRDTRGKYKTVKQGEEQKHTGGYDVKVEDEANVVRHQSNQNGSIPNGIAPNGSIPNGSIPNGIAPNSSITNGNIPNGSVPNGNVTKGIAPHGIAPNGSIPNGSVPNGSIPSGSVPNGSVPNGSIPNAVEMKDLHQPPMNKNMYYNQSASFNTQSASINPDTSIRSAVLIAQPSNSGISSSQH
ncbi:uncharacterized protein [Ptychodera flava]|uniref:uncharacterized protein n=1 Tax=Ptychodera flava TaxID=63121 RepID=UPI00396A8CC7